MTYLYLFLAVLFAIGFIYNTIEQMTELLKKQPMMIIPIAIGLVLGYVYFF
jgi:hypothetical protein